MKAILLIASVFFATQSQALVFDKDVPAEIQSQFQQDLNLVNSIKGNGQSPLHRQIYGDVSGADYKKFLESRIHKVGMDSCGGGEGVAACVQPFLATDKMWLTPNFVKANIPQIARVMVIYHEARHTESAHGFWSHDNCPTPYLDENGHDIVGIVSGAKLEGKPACDSTAFGSYGSSTIMMRNIAKHCANCSSKIQMDADLWANDQLNRIDRAEVKKSMREDFNL